MPLTCYRCSVWSTPRCCLEAYSNGSDAWYRSKLLEIQCFFSSAGWAEPTSAKPLQGRVQLRQHRKLPQEGQQEPGGSKPQVQGTLASRQQRAEAPQAGLGGAQGLAHACCCTRRALAALPILILAKLGWL